MVLLSEGKGSVASCAMIFANDKDRTCLAMAGIIDSISISGLAQFPHGCIPNSKGEDASESRVSKGEMEVCMLNVNAVCRADACVHIWVSVADG